jgi:hypothetical protein
MPQNMRRHIALFTVALLLTISAQGGRYRTIPRAQKGCAIRGLLQSLFFPVLIVAKSVGTTN